MEEERGAVRGRGKGGEGNPRALLLQPLLREPSVQSPEEPSNRSGYDLRVQRLRDENLQLNEELERVRQTSSDEIKRFREALELVRQDLRRTTTEWDTAVERLVQSEKEKWALQSELKRQMLLHMEVPRARGCRVRAPCVPYDTHGWH